ncbi:MAG TPA: hypothetical protein VK021_05950 [Flavobacteriaceae bacterium]|nr:hypothetical protein [Flavobacteriaceae bacterium]
MENSTNQVPVKVGEWVLTFLIVSIPIVNLVMLFVWAFGNNTNTSKANWAKAGLLWMAIIAVIYIFIALVFGASLYSVYS